MEKVKVSKEVFEALRRFESETGGNIDPIVINILKGDKFESREYISLNTIDEYLILKIYKYGYELEETPEEKLLRAYNGFCQNELDRGALIGIEFTLNTLGIKIKGINE